MKIELTKELLREVTTRVTPAAQGSLREISSMAGLDAGRTIIGKLADLPEAQMTHTWEIHMLQCLETLEVKR